ncbi:MAG: hypothetical protein Q9171_001489 [Xanthocarpia ochracea]
MPNRRDRDVEYFVRIGGVPKAVAQQENSWKVVKDVVRNLIDGQPKKVELADSIFWCGLQSHDDAIQVYGMEKQDWYDVVAPGTNRVSATMEVTCLKVQSNGQVEWLRDSSRSGQQGRRLSTASHTRTTSTSSTSSNMWSPISPTAMSSDLLPPTSLMPYSHTPTPATVGSLIPANMAPRLENFAFLPAPAMVPVYGHNLAKPHGFAPNPPAYVQGSAMGHHSAHQNSPGATVQRRQIIVQNLDVGVREHWLKDLFTKSIGPVQECRIEERGDKKRHAFLSFTHTEHAEMAVNLFNKKNISGRKVNVRLIKEVQEGPVIIDGSGVYS